MKTSFLNRIYRAIKIDPDLYEEVEHDKSATFQAAFCSRSLKFSCWDWRYTLRSH